MNTLLALELVGAGLLDVLGIALAAAMVLALIGRAGRNLRRLAELEPGRLARGYRRPEGGAGAVERRHRAALRGAVSKAVAAGPL